MKKVIVTGTAGFIGFHLANKLLKQGYEIVGIDNLNDYYDVNLKEARNKILKEHKNYTFKKIDISEYDKLFSECSNHKVDMIVHLAAQAGVRHSIENPHVYGKYNLNGTLNIFEVARHQKIPKVVYASSSSVYGGNTKVPFSESDSVDKPVSLYAATKKANELKAHAYSHLYGINMTGLRFFTVYGPYGRPDMAAYMFVKNIFEDKPIRIFNKGDMERDFTYVDDIVNGIISAMDKDFKYEIFNLGNSNPEKLMTFVETLEKHCGKKAKKEFHPMQPGDVKRTHADLTKTKEMLGWEPTTNIDEGLKSFIKWYKEYHNIKS